MVMYNILPITHWICFFGTFWHFQLLKETPGHYDRDVRSLWPFVLCGCRIQHPTETEANKTPKQWKLGGLTCENAAVKRKWLELLGALEWLESFGIQFVHSVLEFQNNNWWFLIFFERARFFAPTREACLLFILEPGTLPASSWSCTLYVLNVLFVSK